MQATQHESTGFNLEFGKTWIYPTNLPIRKYQKDIVQEALFKNTMVCLPTGLGKTFIAAVIMYNFYRWYPSGKIIFMATTKPLVKQQVEACYNIVAIPKQSTAELTGSVLKQNREAIWKDKRVFFVTPQVLRNDLEAIEGLGAKIKCIVIDEAHRATGNHAYCEVINKLQELNKNFRVLALTATPASNVVDVIRVCQQLLISHLEVRTEDSEDVMPYLHQKSIQTIVLKIDGKLSEIIEEYKKILDKYVRILVENKVIHSNFSSLHKGRIFYLSKEYQEKNTHNRSTEKYKLVTKVLAICTILYHAYDLLLRHGLRCFLRFYEDSINKPLLTGCSSEIRELMESIKEHVGPPIICDRLPDGSHIKLPENCKFGHPKFYKLREIVQSHFSNNNEKSKIIIFCEYKDSVSEAYAALLEQKSVKPKMFMGQSSITQKQQVNIIESFRSGSFNTLISTCIGEEGIDAGFVDMVICFDISNKSSVRFIQRIGRTGRDRNGKVVILVSEGREQQVLKECLQEKQHLCDALVRSKDIDNRLHKGDPRMIPDGITPECHELFIAPKKPVKLTNFFTSTSSSPNKSLQVDKNLKASQASSLNTPSNLFISNHIPETKFLVVESNQNEDISLVDNECFNFKKHLHLQRTKQAIKIPTSANTDIFIDLMKQIEYSRFNLKSKPFEKEQTGNLRKSTRLVAKKQTDIRNMFKNCTQTTKTPVENETSGLEVLFEAKINNILANTEDCKVCEKFKNDLNIKHNLVPIENLNLKIDLNFDLNTICILQNKINGRLNKSENGENLIDESKLTETSMFDEMHVDSFINLIGEYTKNQKNDDSNAQFRSPVKENVVSEVVEKSPIKNTERKDITTNATQISPDLFEVVPSPEKSFKTSDINNAIQQVIEDDDIIEKSPSPLINKRKASDSSSIAALRAKKRIKFDICDVFDATEFASATNVQPVAPVANNATSAKLMGTGVPGRSSTKVKKKIIASDLLDQNFMEKSVSETLETLVSNSPSMQVHENDDKEDANLKEIKEKSSLSNSRSSDCSRKSETSCRQKRLQKKAITVDDLFDFAPTNATCSSEARSSPDLPSVKSYINSTFVAPTGPAPTKLSKLRLKKQFTASDIFDTSLFPKPANLNASTTSVFEDFKRNEIKASSTVISGRLQNSPEYKNVQNFDNVDVSPTTSTSSLSIIEHREKAKTRRKPRRARQFIDSEVEVSSDEDNSADEHISSQDDVYEVSFVDDNEDIALPSTQTQAMYLQSVRSPLVRGKPLRRVPARHVDDTMMHNTEDLTYAKDTFCVDDNDEIVEIDSESLDELEKAELELQSKRRKKRISGLDNKKRKRIRRIESDSE